MAVLRVVQDAFQVCDLPEHKGSLFLPQGQDLWRMVCRGPQQIFFPLGPPSACRVFFRVRVLTVSLYHPLKKCWAPAMSINFRGSCRYSTLLSWLMDSHGHCGLLAPHSWFFGDQALRQAPEKSMTNCRTHVLLLEKLILGFSKKYIPSQGSRDVEVLRSL